MPQTTARPSPRASRQELAQDQVRETRDQQQSREVEADQDRERGDAWPDEVHDRGDRGDVEHARDVDPAKELALQDRFPVEKAAGVQVTGFIPVQATIEREEEEQDGHAQGCRQGAHRRPPRDPGSRCRGLLGVRDRRLPGRLVQQTPVVLHPARLQPCGARLMPAAAPAGIARSAAGSRRSAATAARCTQSRHLRPGHRPWRTIPILITFSRRSVNDQMFISAGARAADLRARRPRSGPPLKPRGIPSSRPGSSRRGVRVRRRRIRRLLQKGSSQGTSATLTISAIRVKGTPTRTKSKKV